ncbi:MAG: tetratricopeptide repeat protein [Tannerella sp.]|nr:tetratricopeptide repeat protein [Tannerella sp.]
MTIKEINNSYQHIIELLDEGILNTAFDMLHSLIAGTQRIGFLNTLTQLQETYRYMLRYYAEGTDDPLREQIYINLRADAYKLADEIKHQALLTDAPTIYYINVRTTIKHPIDMQFLINSMIEDYEIENMPNYEFSLDWLFHKIWTTVFLSEEDVNAIRATFNDTTCCSPVKCQFVSALLLGLQASFDKKKMYLLFDAASLTDDDETRIRAFIAILLTLYTYRQRIPYYPGIRHRLETLAEMPDFKRILLTVIFRFILSRETESITHKLQEEFIPEMIKFTAKINPNIHSDTPELSGNDMNPEWENIFSDSKLTKQMEEYSNLQEQGVDVMHSTFIHLKQFRFFNTVSNWFLPFTANHSEFKDMKESSCLSIETILNASYLCNSDKYSLYLSFIHIPEGQRDVMIRQMDSQMREMNKLQAEDLKSKRSKAESIAGQYVQDLYRFYKLFPRRSDLVDIFQWKLDFHNLDILKPYLSDDETRMNIADFYLQRNHFDCAEPIYEQLITHITDDEMLYQKLGYCKQMNDNVQGALESYLRSELLNPDSKWLIRRIAGCYRTLKQPENALKYYLRYEQLTQGNVSAWINIGHCHLELGQYDEALKYYFKAEYLEPNNIKAWRAVAWCSFLAGKYEQAGNYYSKIIDKDPHLQDYINYGHTEWALQNFHEAIGHYQSALKKLDNNSVQFRELFKQDIPDLLRAGIKQSELCLMLDAIQLEL